jgi:hypothetical protein
MKRALSVYAALLCCVVPMVSIAAEFGGDQPLICAGFHPSSCESDGECATTSLDEISVPKFLRLNFEEKVIRSQKPNGDIRVTPIEALRNAPGSLLLQGTDKGVDGMFAWSVFIGSTGQMTLTVAADEFAVVVFGECTPNEIVVKK